MADGTCAVEGCTRKRRKRQWCNRHYEFWRLHGTPVHVGPTASERFWAKVDKNGPLPKWAPFLGPCWIWTASLDRKGYGQFNGGVGKTVMWRAHRFVLHLNGTLNDDLVVDHLCRNRVCVRPAHLEQVSNEENIRRGFWRGAGTEGMRALCSKGHDLRQPGAVHINPNNPSRRKCVACMDEFNARRRGPNGKPRAARQRRITSWPPPNVSSDRTRRP